MRPIPECFVAVVLIGSFVAAVAVAGEPECDGPYKARTPTPEDLATVLHNHQSWLKGAGPIGDKWKANLCYANLEEAHLPGANLRKANLQGADLRGANLQQADLFKADLQGAFLAGANLQRADLTKADLQRAVLAEADLQRAVLTEADLQRADLRQANLQQAGLFGTNLQEAGLLGTNLQGALLFDTNLQDANLYGANLQEAIYEANPGKLPYFWTLTDPDNKLETLVFHRSPAALIALREAFKKGGMRTQERQLTYTIEHTRRLQAWQSASLWDKSESLLKLVAFELPSDYGMSYGRPLKILAASIGLFSLVYMIALFITHGRAGIWVTWPTDRVYQEEGAKDATRVTTTFFFPRVQAWATGRWWGVLLRGVSVPLIGLYFSLLSAFSLGWRELNVGTWIARVQSREYVLRATGWVRTVSGLQSLLSVYLLALWVLTYFGRPFE